MSRQAAVDFFAQDMKTSLGAEYWSWVKNQAIEKLYTLGGALTDPGRIDGDRDKSVIGAKVPVINFPTSEKRSVTRTLPILTAGVVRINITDIPLNITVTAGPLLDGLAYKVYVNGECSSEGHLCYLGIPEGERYFTDLKKGDTLYAIIANTNTDPTKRIKYTLTVQPTLVPPLPPSG